MIMDIILMLWLLLIIFLLWKRDKATRILLQDANEKIAKLEQELSELSEKSTGENERSKEDKKKIFEHLSAIDLYARMSSEQAESEKQRENMKVILKETEELQKYL